MHFHLLAFALAALCRITCASPTAQTKSISLPDRNVFQFSIPPVHIENQAIRSNGEIIFGTTTAPEVFLINPLAHNAEPKSLHTFPNVTSVFGITEVAPDIFAVAVGVFNGTDAVPGPNSFEIWKFDFRSAGASRNLDITKVANVPKAVFFNGADTLAAKDGAIGYALVADSVLGAVWKIDMVTGDSEIVIELPEMKPPAKAAINVGINGLKLRDNFIYWTNAEAFTLFRIQIDLTTGKVAAGAKVQTLGVTTFLLDDFIFDKAGNVYQATGANQIILFPGAANGRTNIKPITIEGSQNSFNVAGSTSCRFGRTRFDSEILYVTTGGGTIGSTTQAGKIVAIDIRELKP